MRKIILLFIGMLACLAGFAETFTYTYRGTTLVYETINATDVAVVSWSATLNDVEIPSRVNSNSVFYNVTTIGEKALSNGHMVSIKIPNSVTSIDNSAFEYCKNLVSIIIPNSVTEIGKRAFLGCESLNSIEIPTSLKKISDQTFQNCSSLTSVEIPNSVTEICSNAFNDCYNLISITIPSTIEKFGHNVWCYCPYISEIHYNTDAPIYAFKDIFLDGIYSKATLFLKLRDVEDFANISPWNKFDKVELLPKFSVNLKYTITSSNTMAVTGYEGSEPEDVVVPNQTTDTDGNVYNVTEIRASAFAGNTYLVSITIPENITTIAPGAFKNCKSLEKVNYNARKVTTDNSHHSSLVFDGCTKFTTLNIGNEVTELPQFLFRGTAITKVDIPDNVTLIDNDCFAQCPNLSEIKIGKGVRTIRWMVFGLEKGLTAPETTIRFNATSLQSYNKGGTSTQLSYNPFMGRNVKAIYFGPDVEQTCTDAFDDCSPSNIYCESVVPPTLGNNSLKAANKSSCTLHVPKGSLDTYKVANIWKNFLNIVDDVVDDTDKDKPSTNLKYTEISETEVAVVGFVGNTLEDIIIPSQVRSRSTGKIFNVVEIRASAFSESLYVKSVTIPDNVRTIEAKSFYYCENLESVKLPNSISSIEDWLFYGCSSLESIEIPNSVTSIGEWAFGYCSSLSSVEIPNSVTKIGTRAFSFSGLTSIDIPYSVTEIGDIAFADCHNLTSVAIPNSVTSLGWSTFALCTSLTSVEIPNSITKIEGMSFYYCTNLTSVKIPSSVTEIGDGAFSWCSSLTSVEIPSSVTEIGDYAFSWCSSLTSVEIPNSVAKIGNEAFSSCNSLVTIEIPNFVKEIGYFAFANTPLTSVEIPSSVESIGEACWMNCPSISSVKYMADTPIVTNKNIFDDNVYSQANFYCPKGSYDKYRSTTPWNLFMKTTAIDKESGIGDTIADDSYVTAFNLNGVKVFEGQRSVMNLPAGLYILKHNGKTEKIAIR